MGLYNKLHTHLAIAVVLSLFVFAGCDNMTSSFDHDENIQGIDSNQPTVEVTNEGDDIIPGQYIVHLRTDRNTDLSAKMKAPSIDQRVEGIAEFAKSVAIDVNGEVGHVYSTVLQGFSISIPQEGSEEALRAIHSRPDVDFIEPDRRVYAANDQFEPSWGLDRITQRDLPLNSVYTYNSTGKGVTAYVIDGGINYDHEEFGGRAGSGFSAFDDDGSDCSGHGTSVASIIGGKQLGVAKEVDLVSVKVLDCDGSGTVSTLYQGIEWVTNNASSPAVANVSIITSANSTLDDAIRKSIESGVTYVAAAGNNGRNAGFYSPARVSEVLTVGSTNDNDEKVSNSNFGNSLDVFAPGHRIPSARYDNNSGTRNMTGTSAASPHVAGAVALFLQENSNASPSEAHSFIRGQATKGIVSNSDSNNNDLLFIDAESDSEPKDEDEDNSDKEEEEKEEEVEKSEPVIENFMVVTRNNGPWLRAEVEWRVSDKDGKLNKVTVELLDGNNSVDSSEISVDGNSASGTVSLRSRDNPNSVKITVENSNGKKDTKQINI